MNTKSEHTRAEREQHDNKMEYFIKVSNVSKTARSMWTE